MTVFKTFLKILNKNKFIVIMYTVILLIFAGTNMTTSDNNVTFESSKPKILIVNKDNDKLGDNLVKYMDSITDIENLDDKLIDDALFNRQIHYVIYIPKNYTKDFMNGKNPELEIKKVNTYEASLTEMELKRYIKVSNEYLKTSNDVDDLIIKTNDTLSKNVNVELVSKRDVEQIGRVSFYYNFACYSIMASLLYVICLILSSFRTEKIRKRTTISSMNYKKLNRKLLLSNCLLSICLWLIYVVFSIILTGSTMFSITGLIFIINSFLITLCTTSMAFLIGNLISSKNAINGIVNVVALGSSFLCGVFVPASMLPNVVLLAGHLLPAYWYVNTNNLLVDIEVYNLTTLKPILMNMIVIILFTILFSIISNIVYKKKRRLD